VLRNTPASAFGLVLCGVAGVAVAVCVPATRAHAKKTGPAAPKTGQELVTRVYAVSDLADINAALNERRPQPPPATKAAVPAPGAIPPPEAAKGQPPAAKGPKPQPPSHPLADLIQGCIRPKTWDGLGGPGSIEFSGTGKTAAITVKNTRQVQREIESLLAQLRRLRAAGKAQARPAPLETERPEWEKRIRKALAQKVTVRLQNRPFDEIVRALGKRLGIPILYDDAALKEVEFDTTNPFTLEVTDVHARTALDLLLKREGLTWIFQNEALCITVLDDENDEHHFVRVYDVRDVVGMRDSSGRVDNDFDSLISLITSTTDLSAWDNVGGPGSIEPVEAEGLAALVCSHTREMQELVEGLLAGLRTFHGTRGLPTAKPALTVTLGDGPESLSKVMSRKISLDADQEPFDQVMKRLAQLLGVNVQYDHKALEEVGFEVGKRLTIHVSGISAAAALDFLLYPEGLSWQPWGGVLVITTPDEAANKPFVRVYDVHDLVYHANPKGPGDAGFEPPDFDQLISLITSCVRHTTWGEVGGPGPIGPFYGEGTDLLVFAQTWETHREAEALLDALRAVRHANPPKPGETLVGPFVVPWEKAVRQALDRQIDVSFRRTPLVDVAAALKRMLGIEVQLDAKAIEELEMRKDRPVTFEWTNVSAEKALDEMLDLLKLTWSIRDEVLWITTHDEYSNDLRPRVYDVTGLVPSGKEIDFDWLTNRITREVHGKPWEEYAGPESITPYESQGIRALVVNQSERNRRKTEAVLRDLQKKPPPALIRKPVPEHSNCVPEGVLNRR
jgi:hypothetical protein